MKVLVTGAAGFIGFHVIKRLIDLNSDYSIVGIDNLNDYYDVNLKVTRLKELGLNTSRLEYNKVIYSNGDLKFLKLDVQDKENLFSLFDRERFDIVIHLAAQAGVRYSLINPDAYISSNILGFYNILEGSKRTDIQRLLYASSSSVYGNSLQSPFLESDLVDQPVSLYAATKKSNELMAHTYSHLYGIETVGLRFFTAYGPWGRPDMAYFSFTKAILESRPISIFNEGNLLRDFTYIDDIALAVIKLMNDTPGQKAYEIFNIGNSSPIKLIEFIDTLETLLGKKAIKKFVPMQEGDVLGTFADTNKLSTVTDFSPNTTLEAGLTEFVKWYKDYFVENNDDIK